MLLLQCIKEQDIPLCFDYAIIKSFLLFYVKYLCEDGHRKQSLEIEAVFVCEKVTVLFFEFVDKDH